MSIFSLHANVLEDYRDFVRSFFTVADDRAPYQWDEARQPLLRAELDAWFARAYGLTRDELRYILDPADDHGPDFPSKTFRGLKQKELKQFGEYRTRRLVLGGMAAASVLSLSQH